MHSSSLPNYQSQIGLNPSAAQKSRYPDYSKDLSRSNDFLGIPRKMSIVELVMLIVRSRYEKYMPARKKAIISQAGQRYGLFDAEGRLTSKYFALLNDDAEKLARELTGKTKPIAGECPCGCRRPLRGKAKYATQACQKRVWRRTQGTTENQPCTS